MWLSNIAGGSIVLFFGLLVRVFKMSGLIAGYNTASREEKAKYSEEKLTRYIGNILITSSLVLILGGLLSALESVPDYPAVISWVLFALIITGGLIYINTGDRVKK